VDILTSKIRHENGDKFKNGLSKKGVEYFKLSNDTNKSIANFRETIPLDWKLRCSLTCIRHKDL
jgi:hypothetical protein